MKKLYVKFKKPRTIQEFLYIFYTDRTRNTSIGMGYRLLYLYAGTIFEDKECNKVYENKIFNSRSFDDLFKLVKTYYPSTTKGILFKHLLKFNPKIENHQFYPGIGYCTSNGIIKYFPYHEIYVTDYSLSKKLYASENTWAELCKMINITPNRESLTNYIKNNIKQQ